MKTFLSLCLLLIVGITDPDTDYLLGRFDPASDVRFSKLRPEHTSGAALGGYLRKETYEAFVTMADAAEKEGIRLIIISATRNFESQKKIWENKWNGHVSYKKKINLNSLIQYRTLINYDPDSYRDGKIMINTMYLRSRFIIIHHKKSSSSAFYPFAFTFLT